METHIKYIISYNKMETHIKYIIFAWSCVANVVNEGIDLSSIKYCCFNEYFFVLSEDRENGGGGRP